MRIPGGRPCACEQATIELGTILRVIKEGELCDASIGSKHALTKREGQRRESQCCFRAILDIVLVGIALQTADRFVSTAQFQREILGSFEKIAVCVGE